MVAAGCASTPAAVQAWDDEVVGVVAQVNDVIALRFLPAELGVPEAEIVPTVDGSKAVPDPLRMKHACETLDSTVSLFAPLAASHPESRTHAASEVESLRVSLTRIASRCVELALAGEPSALKGNSDLSGMFKAAGQQEASIARKLHHGAQCPLRLRSTVKSCVVR